MKVVELQEPRVIRWRELMPMWVVPHSREAGYLRFNLSYVGGPEGFVNINRETDLISLRTSIGLMWMPAGQRQFDLHRHTVCESYVILAGEVESINPREPGAPTNIGHRAGVLDMVHMPIGSPHASRTAGTEDVMLLWVHDALERDDAAVYYAEDDPQLAGLPLAEVVDWKALTPSSDAPGAREVGTLRTLKSYLGGGEGQLNHNRGQAIENDRLAAGTLEIPPGNAEPPQAYASVRYCLVTSGTAAVVGRPDLGFAEQWDMVVMPRGETFSLRAVGVEPLQVVWILEEAEPAS